MTVSDRIALVSAIATFLGVAVAVVALVWQLKLLNKQLMLQHFSDYTKRYQEIILRFPEDINEVTFQLEGRPDYQQVMRAIRAYFDLCFEEWYMKQRNLIDDRAWMVWQGGMRTAFSKPAFRQAWMIVRDDTEFGKEFESFVDGLFR